MVQLPRTIKAKCKCWALVQKAEGKLFFSSVVYRSFSTCSGIFDVLYNVKLTWAYGYSHGKCKLLQIPGALEHLTFTGLRISPLLGVGSNSSCWRAGYQKPSQGSREEAMG